MNRPHISRTLFSAFLAVVATVCLALTASADVVTVGSDGYATLTGFVYCDLNDNLMYDDNEGLIPNVWIILSKQVEGGEQEIARTFTGLFGEYAFKKIPSGVYSVTQVQPIEFINGLPNAPGTVNGVPVGEAVTTPA